MTKDNQIAEDKLKEKSYRKCVDCGRADYGDCAIWEEGVCWHIYHKLRCPNKCVCMSCKEFKLKEK